MFDLLNEIKAEINSLIIAHKLDDAEILAFFDLLADYADDEWDYHKNSIANEYDASDLAIILKRSRSIRKGL